MKRRDVLGVAGLWVVGVSGCLRLQGGSDSTPQEKTTPVESTQETTTQPPTETPADDSSGDVTLTENWTDEDGVDNIWTREGTFYYNDYNYAAEASHGSGVNWSAEVTLEGVDENLGTDAFAQNGQYVVFGYTPDPDGNEEQGAHFHAYRRYDGEKMWVARAPSDGKHNSAIGATGVDDIAVLSTSDYGAADEQEPLIWGVDIETGETRWRVDRSTLPTGFIRYLGSYDGDVYVGMNEGVQVLASDTGALTDTYDSWYVGSNRLESLCRIHGETLFAAWQGTFEAHPVGENGLSWSRSELGWVSTPPVVDNSLVVVGTQEGTVYALERGSGETRWEASITNSVGALESTGSHVWVGDTDIGLTAYDRESGSLVHRSTKPINGDDIAVADDVLLLGGDTATAYKINQ